MRSAHYPGSYGDSLQSFLHGQRIPRPTHHLDEKILEKSRGNDDQITFGNDADQASAQRPANMTLVFLS